MGEDSLWRRAYQLRQPGSYRRPHTGGCSVLNRPSLSLLKNACLRKGNKKPTDYHLGGMQPYSLFKMKAFQP